MVVFSTGGIIATGLGVKKWRVADCIQHFMKLTDKAFTPRFPGTRFNRKYRTKPFERALQEAFSDGRLFGGFQDDAERYHTKVAVAATNDLGDKPVILTNYNRQFDKQCKWYPTRIF